MTTIFVAHVRPILEYCSVIWNLGYLCDMRSLESVQRRWTREIDGLGHLGYRERLEELGLYSIFGRLLRMDLIKIWKVFKGGLVQELQGLFELPIHPATRGHAFKLSVPRHRLDIRGRFFAVRCVRLWNTLPSYIVESRTPEEFKSCLDTHLSFRFYDTFDGH